MSALENRVELLEELLRNQSVHIGNLWAEATRLEQMRRRQSDRISELDRLRQIDDGEQKTESGIMPTCESIESDSVCPTCGHRMRKTTENDG